MKFDILLGALLLCIVKATIPIGTVNGNLLNVEEGGSGTDNDTLTNSIEKINGGSKKSIDLDTESSGDGLDGSIDEEISGSGDGDETSSGSGGYPTLPKVMTTVSPTFRISTDRTNRTSQAVVVINTGVSTTAKVPTDKGITPTTDIDNSVEDPVSFNTVSTDDNDPIVVIGKATGEDDSEGSGVNFTVAIIVGVVVGAILSILIIVFLVYRLRKKDEGSYSLDEPSSAMLTAETDSLPHKGKGEYFA